MENLIKDRFTNSITRITDNFDQKYKVNVIITEPNMSTITLEGLVKELGILIHLITFNGGKTAQFRIRQYADVIKILKNYPSNDPLESESLKQFLIKKGKKESKKNDDSN